MKRILGLDLSSSKIGYCIIDTSFKDDKKFLDYGYIDVDKLVVKKNTEADYYNIINKSNLSFEKLKEIITSYNITHVYIEEPVNKFKTGSSSIDTIIKTNLFNYTLSNNIFSLMNKKPNHVPASTARAKVFGKGFNVKGKEWDIKEKVFNQLCVINKNFESLLMNTNKNGNIHKWVFDISDSIVIALYGELKEK